MNKGREYWYEDDVVTYTSRGRFPIIPEKYKYCEYYKINGHTHKLKSFRTYNDAEVAISNAVNNNSKYFIKKCPDTYTIFKCDKCQFYHILLTKNYNKVIYDRSVF